MRPLILDFTIRREETHKPSHYEYDPLEGLNVIAEGERKPLIDSSVSDVDLTTRTKVKMEQDDASVFLDLTTRTRIAGEKDDNRVDYVELATKTLVKTENDDTHTPDY